MAKAIIDLKVIANKRLSPMYSQIVLGLGDNNIESGKDCSDSGAIPDIRSDFESILKSIEPGQFVQIKIEGCNGTFLRRPISINFADPENRQLFILVRNAGEGTKRLCDVAVGETVNVIIPLGKGFSIEDTNKHPLLVGGGVGVAPLLYLGKILKDRGITPSFLLAAKKASDLLLLDEFKKYGNVAISTDDGSMGSRGLVTENPVLNQAWDIIYCCGPLPMMKGIAKISKRQNTKCEVSLENTMACGLGACLCCVEDTVKGNVCVCTEGPVFDTGNLRW